VLGQASLSGQTLGDGAANMNAPMHLAIGADGTLWVADSGNNRILKFVNAPATTTGSSANNVIGQTAFGPGHTSAGSGLDQVSFLVGIAVSADNWLYAFDGGNTRILGFGPWSTSQDGPMAATVVSRVGIPLGYPGQGFYDDATDTLWAVDSGNHRVLRFERMTPGCFEGVMDANFLGGTGPDEGGVGLTDSNAIGQTFTVLQSGTLTGIETMVFGPTQGYDTVHMDVMRGSAVIASGDIPSSVVPSFPVVLSSTSTGPIYFELGGNCPSVTAGETLRYALTLRGAQPGVCDVGGTGLCTSGTVGNPCSSPSQCNVMLSVICDVDLAFATDPYAGGTADGNGTPLSSGNWDGRFKVFVGP
jgi:hypothetical protein